MENNKSKKRVRRSNQLTDLEQKIKKFLNTTKSIEEICNKFNMSPKQVKEIIQKLKEKRYNVRISRKNTLELDPLLPQGGTDVLDLSKFQNKIYKIGFVTDTHLNSKYERLDVLNALYDIFEKDGITNVYHAGNWVDGECSFNKYDLFNVGIDAQIDYFIKNYPRKPNITTKFIAGDDHEGWWVKREKINVGEYMQFKAEEAGRNDLKYLGYIEADIILKAKKGEAKMKIMHPGGGSAYALSYAPQKIVESFTTGEVPQILLLGHYHKAEFLPAYRHVHIVQGGTTQDQTPYMRKKKIAAHLGGWILEFQQSIDGTINRFRAEFISFQNKSEYKNNGFYR